MEMAVKVAKAKYPPNAFKHVWIFDHSCGHTAYATDALIVSRLYHKRGGNGHASMIQFGLASHKCLLMMVEQH